MTETTVPEQEPTCCECGRELENEQVEIGLCKTHEESYRRDARRERRGRY